MGRFKRYILCILGISLLLAGEWVFAEETTALEFLPSAQGNYELSLDEATRLALKNSFDIQLAKYDARMAKTKKEVAESIYDTFFDAEVKYKNDQSKQASTLTGTKTLDNDYNVGISKKLPVGAKVSVDMLNNRHWTNSAFVSLSPSHDSSLGLTVEQSLGKNLFGIQDRGNVKITKIDIENAEYTSLDKIENSLLDVQKAYWDLVLAYEFLRIEEGILKQAETLYNFHQEKLKDGLIEAPEALASEANYKERMSELLVAQNNVKTKMNELKLLLNIEDENADIIPKEKLSLSGLKEDKTESLQKAFQNRRDYKAAQNDIAAKKIKLSMSKNNLWPEINLKASLARNGIGDHFKQAIDQISDEDNPELITSVVISFPLENTKARAELDQSQIEKAKALLILKLFERKIFIKVVDNVRTCHVLFERAQNRQVIAELQERKLSEEQKRFNYGRSNTDTIIRFQDDLLQAKWQAAAAIYDYLVSTIDLRKNEGSLLNSYWEGKF